ncbi:MAG TPA: hypothetical protein VFC79_11155 [Tissierellaceae bacterium]|nr:hypothetical protein [Tissierellaceae bacterium]
MVKDFLLGLDIEKCSDWYQYYDKAVELGYGSEKESFKRYCRKLYKKEKRSITTKDINGEVSRTTNTNGSIESVIRSNKMITTVDEMAEFCKINKDDFLPPKIVTNRWGNADNPSWQFKVWWIPKYTDKELTPKDAMKEFDVLLLSKETKVKVEHVKRVEKEGKTVVIGLSDLHVGSLTWKHELSCSDKSHYDLKIAEQEIYKAIQYYYDIYKDDNIKEFIIPLGNDFLDINNDTNTTINGTVQDVDNRPRKIFSVGLRIMKHIIDTFLQIAPVKGIYMPANHDTTTSYFLTRCIQEYYRNDDNVIIDDRPNDRKYIKVGNTLIGLTHGKTIGKPIKPEQLPALMSNEAREYWAECDNKEWLTGHLHTLKNIIVKDYQECIVRVMPTILTRNYWADASGYSSVKQMEAYEYDEDGIVGIRIYKPKE